MHTKYLTSLEFVGNGHLKYVYNFSKKKEKALVFKVTLTVKEHKNEIVATTEGLFYIYLLFLYDKNNSSEP